MSEYISSVPKNESLENISSSEKEKQGRTLHLVLLHNFELDKATGQPRITQEPERLQKLIDHIGSKSGIVKIYNGIPKENDSKREVTQITTDLLTQAMEEQGKSIRSTRSGEELQRLPGTPGYYAYLAGKSREENPAFSDLDDSEVLARTGAAIYDLCRKYPDPTGEIPTAEEMSARFNKILNRLKRVAERSPDNYPDATLVLIVDRAIQSWLFDQTGISSEEMGKIEDDEPVEMTFTGMPDEPPTFTFKGRTYIINLEKLEAKHE